MSNSAYCIICSKLTDSQIQIINREYKSDLHSNEHYLSSSENKAWKNFRPVQDLNPWPLNFFSSLIFTTAQVVFVTMRVAFIFTSLSAVHLIHFSYIHSQSTEKLSNYFNKQIINLSVVPMLKVTWNPLYFMSSLSLSTMKKFPSSS